MSKSLLARTPSVSAQLAAQLGMFIGLSSGLLCLILAWLMLQRHGNPAFLLIWLAAATAITGYVRFNHRWLASFERISRQTGGSAGYAARGSWDGEAIDVVFKDLPDTPAPGDRLAA